MRVITLEDAAMRLGLSPRSLADKRFRIRLGLPGIKLGRRLGFDEGDVEQLIAHGREKMPIDSSAEGVPGVTK
jgi:hypothetical protein